MRNGVTVAYFNFIALYNNNPIKHQTLKFPFMNKW